MAITIILDKVGIETAITNHLGSVVSDIPEDSVIDIKLTANKAKVTVMTAQEAEEEANKPAKAKPGPKPANPTPVDPNAPVKRRGRPRKVDQAQATQAAEAPVAESQPLKIAEKIEEAKAEPEAVDEKAPDVTTETGQSPTVDEAVDAILEPSEDAPTDVGVAEPFGEGEDSDDAAGAEEAAPRQSLFGSLNKPKN